MMTMLSAVYWCEGRHKAADQDHQQCDCHEHSDGRLSGLRQQAHVPEASSTQFFVNALFVLLQSHVETNESHSKTYGFIVMKQT